MNIKRGLTSIADKITNKVDKQLIDYLDRYISDDMSVLEKALSIYLCLGDVLRYSPYFCLTHDYSKTNMVRDINLENNEMICKNWSILYYRLLKHYGIKAKINKSKSHYKVEMVLDDVIYSMDATGYGGNSYFYSISDTARIKCGLKIDRFMVSGTVDPLDINRFTDALEELNVVIDRVYERQGRTYVTDEKYYKLKNKVATLVEEHARVVGVGSLDDINYRIKVLNRFWGLNIIDSTVEKIQLFNAFYKALFEDLDDYGYENKCYSIYAYKNHKLEIYKLIAIDIDGNYFYYMDDGKRFSYYSKDELKNEFRIRNIRVTEFTEIMGMFIESRVYRVKMRG